MPSINIIRFRETEHGLFETMWQGLSRIYQIAHEYVVGVKFKSIQEIQQTLNTQFVYLVTRPPAEILTEFQHPLDNVTYCFGEKSLGFKGQELRDGIRLYIPTPTDNELWPMYAAAIVLHDRFIKLEKINKNSREIKC